jgi:hypothetical protein
VSLACGAGRMARPGLPSHRRAKLTACTCSTRPPRAATCSHGAPSWASRCGRGDAATTADAPVFSPNAKPPPIWRTDFDAPRSSRRNPCGASAAVRGMARCSVFRARSPCSLRARSISPTRIARRARTARADGCATRDFPTFDRFRTDPHARRARPTTRPQLASRT